MKKLLLVKHAYCTEMETVYRERERERAVGILSIGCWVLFFLSGKWSLHQDYR